MSDQQFVSYAQNAEDVVLWRVLGHVGQGRYVDVGANDPFHESTTRVFAERGWSGLLVEPVPELAQRLREARPGAAVFEGVAAASAAEEVVLHYIPDSGLSSTIDSVGRTHSDSGREVHDIAVPAAPLDRLLEDRGWEGEDLHLLTIDVEGAEADVLKGLDLARWRPWVVMIESTEPLSTVPSHEAWEPGLLEAGYEFCLFDGLNRFYVAPDRADDLRSSLSYPACILDDYVPVSVEAERDRLRQENNELLAQVVHWRTTAFGTWARAVSDTRQQVVQAQQLKQARSRVRELQKRVQRVRGRLAEAEARVAEIERSTSWRVTGPLRGATGSARRLSRRGQ